MNNRELDALVAEKVMGWQNIRGSYRVGESRVYICEVSEWKPTEDITAAWQVVAGLSDKFYCQITTPYLRYEPYWCYFEYHGTSDTHPLWRASATTAPLAICLAALKACGVELEAGEGEG